MDRRAKGKIGHTQTGHAKATAGRKHHSALVTLMGAELAHGHCHAAQTTKHLWASDSKHWRTIARSAGSRGTAQTVAHEITGSLPELSVLDVGGQHLDRTMAPRHKTSRLSQVPLS